MCELFGVCAAESMRANELLESFYQHSREHKDGWGLAVFHGAGVSLEKEPVKALDSVYLKRRLSRPVEAANLFAHIRYATIGRIEYANCHPFVWTDESGRTWTLMHNGTMFDSTALTPFLDSQEGTTDSERVLMYIVSCMNRETQKKQRPLSADERFEIMDRLVVELSFDNKLNLLVYDGELMYAHTNSEGSLYEHISPGRVLIATQPVRYDGWVPMPLNTLIAFRAGEPYLYGTRHDHDFHEEDHDMTSLMAAFSEL